MSITIIFFESALELIPETLRNHPLIKKEWRSNVKKKNRGIILDGAIHRSLINLLEAGEKRGRPDIIHHSLLNLVYSPLFLEGKINVLIHTRSNLCIKIPSIWRIPVNYNRFIGLFAQLLLNKRVPLSGDPLLTAEHCTLEKILQGFEGSEIFLCEASGEKNKDILVKNLEEISEFTSKVFLIGGFQHGDPESEFLRLSPYFFTLTLYKDIKPAWVITAKLIHWLEAGHQW